jgi:hypothetical protein
MKISVSNKREDMLKNTYRVVSEETSAKAKDSWEGVELEELQRKRGVDRALDDALAGTFPASDPVALTVLG